MPFFAFSLKLLASGFWLLAGVVFALSAEALA
jgi:hypothetical protein